NDQIKGRSSDNAFTAEHNKWEREQWPSGDPVSEILLVLGDLCPGAALTAREFDANDGKPAITRLALAADLAAHFQAITGQKPQAKTTRDRASNHPYMAVLKAVLDYAEQRDIPLTTLEHVARDGINLVAQHQA